MSSSDKSWRKKIGKYTGKKWNVITSLLTRNRPNLESGSLATPLFTIQGHYDAKVVKTTDGDTVHVVMEYPRGQLTRFVVRLFGINAPEMRGDEKEDGIHSKLALSDKIGGRLVVVECKGFGKYGRLLGTIYYDGVNINEWLVEGGWAESHVY